MIKDDDADRNLMLAGGAISIPTCAGGASGQFGKLPVAMEGPAKCGNPDPKFISGRSGSTDAERGNAGNGYGMFVSRLMAWSNFANRLPAILIFSIAPLNDRRREIFDRGFGVCGQAPLGERRRLTPSPTRTGVIAINAPLPVWHESANGHEIERELAAVVHHHANQHLMEQQRESFLDVAGITSQLT